MKLKEYETIVKEKSIKEEKIKNVIIAFLFGGLMGIFGQVIANVLNKHFSLSLSESYMYTMIVIVIIGAILTGIGIFDKIVAFAKAGLLVPTTGFVHAMTSAAMDSKKEGFIKGIGANIFKLAGSVILYAIVFGFFVALIKGVLF